MGPHSRANIFYGVTWPATEFYIDNWDKNYSEALDQLHILGIGLSSYGEFISGSKEDTFNYLYFKGLGGSAREDELATIIYFADFKNTEISAGYKIGMEHALDILKIPLQIREKLKLNWYLAATVTG